ncbi:MAG: transposase [Meiothermus sp.]|nr:MAG: transposase [Meiothermus sp.]
MSPAPVVKYLQALLVSVANHTCAGLADAVEGIAHDTLNRLLKGKTQLLAMLQHLAIKPVQKGGYLILDDTTLQKFTTGLGCIFKVKDSKTGGFILGIQVVLLLWTNGTLSVPVGFHLYRGKEKHSKHDLALQLLRKAKQMGIEPAYVLFDAWYASARLLHYIREQGWQFVTRLKKNRSLNGKQLRYFRRGPYWSALGYLRGGIPVVVYRWGSKFYAGSDLELDWPALRSLYKIRSTIEETFRVLKQECGWEGVQQQSIPAYRRHLTLGLLAFLYLDQLKSRRKTTPYKLRRLLISGKLKVSELELQRFLEAA